MNSEKTRENEREDEADLEMKDLQPQKDAKGGAQKKEGPGDPITEGGRQPDLR